MPLKGKSGLIHFPISSIGTSFASDSKWHGPLKSKTPSMEKEPEEWVKWRFSNAIFPSWEKSKLPISCGWSVSIGLKIIRFLWTERETSKGVEILFPTAGSIIETFPSKVGLSSLSSNASFPERSICFERLKTAIGRSCVVPSKIYVYQCRILGVKLQTPPSRLISPFERVIFVFSIVIFPASSEK